MQKVTLPEIGKVSNDPVHNHEGLKRVYVPKPKKVTNDSGAQCEILKSNQSLRKDNIHASEPEIIDLVTKSIQKEFI